MAFRSLTQHYMIDPAQITEEKIEESKRNAADFVASFASWNSDQVTMPRHEVGFTAHQG